MKRKTYPLQESEHDVTGCGEEILIYMYNDLYTFYITIDKHDNELIKIQRKTER